VVNVGISRSVLRSENGQRVKTYWEWNKMLGGGNLHEILQDRRFKDEAILQCLNRAMEDKDGEGIMICGHLLTILMERDRRNFIYSVLGPTS